MTERDVIVIGAGHNGLVLAGYLARAGERVTVLERRKHLGGACVTEELIPGARFSTAAYVVSSLRPQIVRELELERFGLEVYATDVLNFVMGPSHDSLFLWPELDRTIRELEKLNDHDAATYVDFGIRLQRFAKMVTPYLLTAPPSLSEVLQQFEAAGESDLWHEFVTISIRDLLDRYFQSDLLKGLFMFFALVSAHAGPSSPGTAYQFSHYSWGEYKGEFGRFGFARGGMGSITQALAASARHFGARIETEAQVERIEVERGSAKGVRLSDGTVLSASIVVSNADPCRTYLKFLDSTELPSEVLRLAQHIDMRGSMARLHLLVDELPKYIGFSAEEGPQHRGFTLLGASPAVFERGWEAQQRGELMEEYPIELIIQSVTDSSLAPVGMHTITTGIQQLPLHLAQGDWDSRREEFTEKVLKSLFRYAPNLAHAIRGQVMLTPLDWERDFSLTGGNITHGAMTVNQLFDSRPMAGWGHYRSPIKGLYLCGAGTHPGGGVMGAAGHNAAEAILADLRGEAPDKPHVQVKRGVVDSLASDPRIRTLRGRVLRQPWLRPLVRSLTKANK